MILSTHCFYKEHHLCDGWYGHETAECECSCHSSDTQETEPQGSSTGGTE